MCQDWNDHMRGHPSTTDIAFGSIVLMRRRAADANAALKQGMPCMRCAHPTCKHGFARLGVMACPQCEAGTVVLDAVSFPKWRLDCSRCNYLVYLPPDLHAVKVTSHACEVRTRLHRAPRVAQTCIHHSSY